MTKKTEQDLLIDILAKDAKPINLMSMIEDYNNKIRDITRHSTKVSKAAQAYSDEETEKLLYLQDTLKKAVCEAYDHDLGVYQLTDSFGNMKDNFEIKVYVTRKEK